MTTLIENTAPEGNLRDRLRQHGIDQLSARDVLALIVAPHGDRSSGTLDVAAQLLHHFGSLRTLAGAHPEDVARVAGADAAASIAAAFQLFRLAVREADHAVAIRSPADIASVAWSRISGLPRERNVLLVCDARHRLRHVETVSMGGIDFAHMPVREILNCVLRHDGRAFAVAHNHPGGDPRPSDADVECSIALQAAAETVHLTFLGQVVVADTEWHAVETELRPYWCRWHLTAESRTPRLSWTPIRTPRRIGPSPRARGRSADGRPPPPMG